VRVFRGYIKERHQPGTSCEQLPLHAAYGQLRGRDALSHGHSGHGPGRLSNL
jgi:hypothetical protein